MKRHLHLILAMALASCFAPQSSSDRTSNSNSSDSELNAKSDNGSKRPSDDVVNLPGYLTSPGDVSAQFDGQTLIVTSKDNAYLPSSNESDRKVHVWTIEPTAFASSRPDGDNWKIAAKWIGEITTTKQNAIYGELTSEGFLNSIVIITTQNFDGPIVINLADPRIVAIKSKGAAGISEDIPIEFEVLSPNSNDSPPISETGNLEPSCLAGSVSMDGSDACWHLGATGSSCDSTCAGFGGFHQDTINLVGYAENEIVEGSSRDARCREVIGILLSAEDASEKGDAGFSYDGPHANGDPDYIGCFTRIVNTGGLQSSGIVGLRDTSGTTTSQASEYNARRVCGCKQ